MHGGGDDHVDLDELDQALVSAGILLSEKYGIETVLERPKVMLNIQQVCEIVADRGSPPLRIGVAQDLAAAGFDVAALRPLLVSLLPPGSEDADLEAKREELARLGPTVVSFPDFPPGSPKPDPSTEHLPNNSPPDGS
jgi:hypothetical protein